MHGIAKIILGTLLFAICLEEIKIFQKLEFRFILGKLKKYFFVIFLDLN